MIDTAEWKYFNFPRIFNMRKGFYNKKPEPSGEGTIPFIGATDKNNGVTGHFTLEEIEASTKSGDGKNHPIEDKLFPKNALCVTNNGSVGFAYFQKNPFTCSHDVNPLYRIGGDFNEYTALFVATVIMHDRYRWGYGRKWRPERMKQSRIKLPIKQDDFGNPVLDSELKYSDEGFIPDWEYMEDTIRRVKFTPAQGKAEGNNSSHKHLNTSKFKLSELDLEIYKAKSHYKVDLSFSKSPKPGWIKFVSRTEQNNSVDGWVRPEADMTFHKGNAIVIGDTTATISYQAKDFVAGEHIIIIRGKSINQYTGTYLVSLLRKEKYRYSYGRAFNIDLVKSTDLPLPTKDGIQPDWKYMENYIKNLKMSINI